MSGIIYIEPRNNPEYLYYKVLTDINTNFSNLYSGGSGVFLSLTGGTLTGAISGTSANFSGSIYSANTDLYQIFVANYDTLDGGEF